MRSFVVSAILMSTSALAGTAAAQDSVNDRRVPTDATGPLAEFAGRGWWNAMVSCNAAWSRLAETSTDEVQRRAAIDHAVQFRLRTVERFEADRGISFERAQTGVTNFAGHQALMQRHETAAESEARREGCAVILAEYDRANR